MRRSKSHPLAWFFEFKHVYVSIQDQSAKVAVTVRRPPPNRHQCATFGRNQVAAFDEQHYTTWIRGFPWASHESWEVAGVILKYCQSLSTELFRARRSEAR